MSKAEHLRDNPKNLDKVETFRRRLRMAQYDDQLRDQIAKEYREWRDSRHTAYKRG